MTNHQPTTAGIGTTRTSFRRMSLMASAIILAALALSTMPVMAQGQNPPPRQPSQVPSLPPLNAPPALNLQQMMEALRDQVQPSAEVRERLTPRVIPPRLDGIPALDPPSPASNATARPPALAPAPAATTPALPSQLAPLAPPTTPPAPVTLPDTLAPFTEPEAPPAPAAGSSDAEDDNATGSSSLPDAPGLGPMADPLALMRLDLGDEDDPSPLSPELAADLEIFAKAFGGDTGMAVSADIMRAQHLAVTFVDTLFRRDRARIRAVVGVPFYADDFPVETEENLNRLMGEPTPIVGPIMPVVPERQDDRLIGINTMRIAELRDSEFYIGDRGADLLALDEDDFYVYMIFMRDGFQRFMVVYIRRVGEDRFEVAGFFD